MFRTRILAGVAGIVFLTGCSFDLGGSMGLGGSVKPQAQVVGDEPYAVKTGAAILARGGSAADAATAIYFVMSVTYPAVAGLGGGGICIVHDSKQNVSEEFIFLPRDAAGGGAFAIPGNVRGFAAMQGAYGVLPWQKVVAPGEGYARAGFTVTRALRARLGGAADTVRLDAGLAGEFMDEAGQIKDIGAVVSNSELADTLAVIRTQGPEVFYSGTPAQAIVEYSASQGGAIAASELAAAKPDRLTPRVTQVGGNYVFLPVARNGTAAGGFIGALIDTVSRGQADANVAPAGAVQRTLTSLNLPNPTSDLGATGFAVTDAGGQAVACAVTMNGSFGSGHTARGTGVTLARANAGAASAFLAPVIASSSDNGPALLAGAGAGGPNGSAVIADALLRLGRGEAILTSSDLHASGSTPYDTANAIVCTGAVCTALPDRSANGLGLAVPMPETK